MESKYTLLNLLSELVIRRRKRDHPFLVETTVEGLLVNRPRAETLEVLTLEGQVVVGSLDDPVDDFSSDGELHVAHIRQCLLLSREDVDRWQASLTLFFRDDLRPVRVLRR